MTYTIESAQSIFSSTQVPSQIPAIIARFDRLSVDDRLSLLWYAYTEMGKTITPAAPGAARLQFAERMLNDIRQMSNEEQMKVMSELAKRADTPISRTYGYFSVNTKLAFWYELGELMKQGLVTPVPTSYKMSPEVEALLDTIKNLDAGQQITVLRNTVVDMGFDTDVASSSEPKVAEPMFERDAPPPTKIAISGINEPAVLSYVAAMNADDFKSAVELFTPDGALQPPFQKPIVGRDAIAKYMREEAQGLNMMPQQGISEVTPDGSKQVKVTGVVQTPWFGVNVGMNISWRFLINPENKIFFVAIDMLATPEELINLRPTK